MIKQNTKFILSKILPTVFYTFAIFSVIVFIEKLTLPNTKLPLIYFMQLILFIILVCLSYSFSINTFYYQLASAMGSTRKNFYYSSLILEITIAVISFVIFVFFTYALTFLYDIRFNFTPINTIAIFFSILLLVNISLTMGAMGLIYGKIMIVIYTVFITFGSGIVGGLVGFSINVEDEYPLINLTNKVFNYIDKQGLIIIAVSAVLIILMSVLNYHLITKKTA